MKKIVRVGNVSLGDGKIYVQSMTNTDTKDVVATLRQIRALANAGADLVRVSVPDTECAKRIGDISSASPVPIIADIHYGAEPALIAVENGVKKIRINPFNMSDETIRLIAKKCASYNVPIRVGVNNGSAGEKRTAKALAEAAVNCAKRIEDAGCDRLVLAVKTSDVKQTVEAYRFLHTMTAYPLHVGLTEAGTAHTGEIRSAVAIGALLLDGIGDTIRVSLAGDPVREVYAAKRILRAVGIDRNYVQVIACPTCARTCVDVERIAEKIENATRDVLYPVKIAVMGCVVNGIGESRDADFGVAGGKEKSVLFSNGKIYKTVENENVEKELLELLYNKIHG